MTAAPRIEALPPQVRTLADHAARAEERMGPAAWAYLAGTAGDGLTHAANRAAWDATLLAPRVLQTLAGGHTQRQLLGRTLAHPILVAPVAFQHLAHPDGELATAVAAAAQGAGFVLATQSGTAVETVAKAVLGDADRGPLWFQLYWQHDRGFNAALVQRAEAAGCEAIALTVDAPVQGVREAERAAGFALPAGIRAVHLDGLAPLPAKGVGLANGLARHAPTWDDVAWLRANTRLPVVLKGLLRADDAREAQRLGVQAAIVSNHGGRTLDGAVATARALPAMVDATGGALELLVDGGIRRGTDVLKACALGARAVLVGRPCIWGLASAGAVGVAHVLRLLRDELEIAMAQCGCATLDAATPGLLHGR